MCTKEHHGKIVGVRSYKTEIWVCSNVLEAAFLPVRGHRKEGRVCSDHFFKVYHYCDFLLLTTKKLF